jgi:TM2 domain-containing membrane protein YozV
MKSKSTTAILAFFLGGIGVHRFYLGQTGLGFLYLIFFWTFIPAIIAFIDFIIFLTMSDEKFNEKYNAGNAMPSMAGVDNLDKLHSLKEKGVITAEEFETQKRRLLR